MRAHATQLDSAHLTGPLLFRLDFEPDADECCSLAVRFGRAAFGEADADCLCLSRIAVSRGTTCTAHTPVHTTLHHSDAASL